MHSPLCTLPAELLFEIISHLDGGDLLRAGCSCRKLYAVAIPILYRFISLGFYGVERALRYPALGSSPSSPLQTFRVLRALENPELARHASM